MKAVSNSTVPSQQITGAARDVLDRNLDRVRAMLVAPVMSATNDGNSGLCGADLVAYLDAAVQFVVDCQRALKVSDAQQPDSGQETPGSSPSTTEKGCWFNPETTEREYLQMINNSLLVGLASFAELQRVKRELEATVHLPGKEIADHLKIVTPDEDEAGQFANALHLVALALGAVSLS